MKCSNKESASGTSACNFLHNCKKSHSIKYINEKRFNRYTHK